MMGSVPLNVLMRDVLYSHPTALCLFDDVDCMFEFACFVCWFCDYCSFFFIHKLTTVSAIGAPSKCTVVRDNHDAFYLRSATDVADFALSIADNVNVVLRALEIAGSCILARKICFFFD